MISLLRDEHKRERLARLLCKAVNLGLLVLVAWIFFYVVKEFTTPKADDQKGMDIRVAYDRDCSTADWDETFRLVKAASVTVKIKAESYWNASGLILEKGATYNFKVIEESDWKDAGKDATAEGWIVPATGFLSAMRSLARAPNQEYFYLMGALRGACYDGLTCEKQFPIGKETKFTAPADGEFCSFANDIPFMYWNNNGSITLTISRL